MSAHRKIDRIELRLTDNLSKISGMNKGYGNIRAIIRSPFYMFMFFQWKYIQYKPMY